MSDYEHTVERLSDADQYACGHCGEGVDPLRAARVRLFGERFYYFCSQACDEHFDPREHRRSSSPKLPRPGLVQDDHDEGHSKSSPEIDAAVSSEHRADEASVSPTDRAASVQAASTTPEPRGAKELAPPRTNESPSTRLLVGSMLISGLSIVLLLATDSAATTIGRSLLVGLAAALLTLKVLRFRDPLDAQPWFEVLPFPLLSLILTIAGTGLGWENAPELLAFSATTILSVAALSLLLRRLQEPVDHKRSRISADLDGPGSRVRGDAVSEVDVSQLRPGEEVVIHAGETVVADVTLVAGHAEIYPWLGSPAVQQVRTGDFVFAGAKLASGQVRATIRWHGLDRHWLRLTHDPARRVDVVAPLVRFARKVAWRGGLSAAAGAAAVGVAADWGAPATTVSAVAAAALLGNPALFHLPALRAVSAVLRGLEQGIVFKSAAVLEAAARVSTAVFCARGTLLLGEPELSSIDPLGGLSPDEVLSLVAGAEQAGHDPVAVAVQRAARAHGVRPDAVRSPDYQPGLGVTAVTSTGQPLVVGSRALLLRERISVARAEQRITELEAAGRTVLLVACNHHLVGILALQDGLRAGARAAVQHLLDVGIEPVLLSGDGRETCAAVGRTIDVDHVRPDVLPSERGQEVARLRSGGANVAVVGRSPTDDIALSAASVSVALPGPGNTNGDFDIELAGDEVQKAALALRIAHDNGRDSLRSVVICAGGGTLGILCLLGLGLPVAWMPLLGLGFSLFAAGPLLGSTGRAKPMT